MKSPISAVIITKNEEKNIARCIESLLPLTDDIIIVDSHSTDKTAEICKRYPVHFETRTWQGYSNTKNYGNSIAKYNYILSIDADEELSDTIRASIAEQLQNPIHAAYEVAFITNFCGKWIRHGAWYPDRHICIFDKHKARWEGQLHETVTVDKNESIGKITKGHIHHYTIENLHEYIEKINYYTTMYAIEMHEKGKKAGSIKLYLSPCFSFFRDYVVKLGFLDGAHGYTIAKMSAHYVFLKYMKLKMMKNRRQ